MVSAVFASRPKGKFTEELLLKIADRVPGLRGADFDAGAFAEALKGDGIGASA
ncbi:hypothetical protein OTB20_14810 [Streptomyces sp. H27-H1]|uniref:hypothetical protein n=1 Tax=Streptomyces sp. H27-H1 TaxID=2996461 RepID=UPI002270EE1E|nr:hypothetical protein [Streptomyces sp. H27-H1]MCY0927458.1 hypothetical protein [Streptomyces sp. H27-H1]